MEHNTLLGLSAIYWVMKESLDLETLTSVSGWGSVLIKR
jgi:hypothetical protein